MEPSPPVFVSASINEKEGFSFGLNAQKGATEDYEEGNDPDTPAWQVSAVGCIYYLKRWPWALVCRDNWRTSVKDFLDELAFSAGCLAERPLKDELRFLDSAPTAAAVGNTFDTDAYTHTPKIGVNIIPRGIRLQAMGGEVDVGEVNAAGILSRALRFTGKTQAGQIATWWMGQFNALANQTHFVEIKGHHLYEYEKRDKVQFRAPNDDPDIPEWSYGTLTDFRWRWPDVTELGLAYAWIEGDPDEWEDDPPNIYARPRWYDVSFNAAEWPSTSGFVNIGRANWLQDQGSAIVALRVYIAQMDELVWRLRDTVPVPSPSNSYGHVNFPMTYLGPDHVVALQGVDSAGRVTEVLGPWGPFDSPPVEYASGMKILSPAKTAAGSAVIDLANNPADNVTPNVSLDEFRTRNTTWTTVCSGQIFKREWMTSLYWTIEHKLSAAGSMDIRVRVNGSAGTAVTGLTATTWTRQKSGATYALDISGETDDDYYDVEVQIKEATGAVWAIVRKFQCTII
jgi:hypothetical protein